jgi:seryl-tRNA synthetase
MTTSEFQSIKTKINEVKQKKTRAEGAIAQIEDQWNKTYGISDIDSAKKKLEELKTSVEEEEKELDALYVRLEKVTDWSTL